MFYNRCMSSKSRKKNAVRRVPAANHGPAVEDAGIGVRGALVLGAALALACAGYFFLKKTDPAGKNFYAILSPVFLLAGYLLVPAVLLPFRSIVKPEDK